MTTIPDELKSIADDIREGKTRTSTVRELLKWFGYERRGRLVNLEIRAALEQVDLSTLPAFEYDWIDGVIGYISGAVEGSSESPSEPDPDSTSTGDDGLTVVEGAVEDPTYRIGKLDAANQPPVSVRPTAPLSAAITVMLREDFSQLPVMTTATEVKGAVTWRSIASKLALGCPSKTVQDCMDHAIEIVPPDISLFRAIEVISRQGFVLVRDKDKTITGIVTAADMSESFDQLGRPFLLLSEIENHIRGIMVGKFSKKELQDAKNPGDGDREISDVSDLTFGEYVRLLENPDKWKKVELDIDQKTFVTDLKTINQIRNDVMHFDPDGIGDKDLDQLKKIARFVQELRDIVGK